ncbi:hypothetical protein WICMUC_003875 [Wickerhamomyces mucosus]|uniref:Association with the SNF1 complex (ASC) domain-containing protein n=1 Tax=Wickerhamomyces mucosus TaxID=1378264 RepID=A0A9P8PKL4_9ASCO|nr:hypothetical protein WICMUC_003875 [Wickerhamomyces mucosus]
MGHNSSTLNQLQKKQLGPGSFREPESEDSSRMTASKRNQDQFKPTIDHREFKSVHSKAKPTSSVSEVSSNNLFLDNIIEPAPVIDGGNGDYFNYKQIQERPDEIDNELTLLNSNNEDEIFDDDDIYTPGLENPEFMGKYTIKYKDPNLSPKDVVAIIGNFNNQSNKISLTPIFSSSNKFKHWEKEIQLPTGIYKCKFLINNREIKYSNDLSIATDKSGNVVNWFEIKPSNHGIYGPYYISPNNRSASSSSNPLSRLKNNSTTSSFSLSLTKEKHQYSKDIPELYIPFIPNLHSNDIQEIPEIDESFLHKNPIPELPIYLNNSYLNKQFNQVHPQATANQPVTNMKGLNFHIIPHVNLNHLLTSNIKDEVLTVACTTRYKGKFVTQIMYSPTTNIEEEEYNNDV